MNSIRKTITTTHHKVTKLIGTNDFYIALVAGCIMIGLVIVIGLINNHVIALYPNAHFHYTTEPNNPLKLLSNWDGPDYLRIAIP